MRYSELELFDKGGQYTIRVFSMEKPCWSPRDGLQNGGRKPVETCGVYFGSLKTFILSVKLEKIPIGTSVNILVTQNSKT